MRGVVFHGVLACAGLLLAFSTWTRDTDAERPDDEVVISECAPATLGGVTFTDERKVVRVRVDRAGAEPGYRIRVESSPPDGEPTTEEFVGGEATKALLEGLATLRAVRALGDVDAARLEALGLKEPKQRLELDCGGRARAFVLGGATFGSADRYLRAAEGGPVFLVASAVLGGLTSPESALMQRELHRLDLKDVETLVVRGFGKERRIAHHDRLDPERASWVDAADPDRVNEELSNWVDNRLARLRVQKYLPEGAEPGSELTEPRGPTEPVLGVEFLGPGGRRLVGLELVAVEVGGRRTYYGRSDVTRGWVTLPRSVARQVDEEVRPVLGAEALPAEVAPAPPVTPPPTESADAPPAGVEDGHGHP